MCPSTIRQRILLVDQEQAWLTFGQTVLAQDGYMVQTAASAAEAWDQIQTGEFDLVLMDLQVVEQGNIAIGKIMASQYQKKHHVVIMSPTNLTPASMRAMFKLGTYDCVDKQYDDAGLRKLIDEQLAEIDRPLPCIIGGAES